ncbi:hypothetical protein GGF46_002180 [Coemansia sp. RSA 552]|nr:hypothetical protein GGF46_002180 [Coemansia sp. RSA 552]
MTVAEDPEDWKAGSRNYRIRAWTVCGFGVVYTVFAFTTLFMFVSMARNKRSGLEKRSTRLVTIQALGCYLVGVTGLVSAAMNNWPCFVKLWLFNVGFVLSLSAMLARAFHLLVVFKVHELTTRLSARDPQKIIEELAYKPPPVVGPSVPGFVVHHSLVGGGTTTTTTKNVENREGTEPRHQLQQQLKKYRLLLRYVSDCMLLMYIGASLAFSVVLTLIINITNSDYSLSPVNIICGFVWGFVPVTALIIICFFVVFPIILWRVWRNRDAYGIRHDLIICDTVGIADLILSLVWVNALHDIQPMWPGLSFIFIYAILIHISSVFVPLVNAWKHNRKCTAHNAALEQNIQQDGGLLPHRVSAPLQHTTSHRADFNRMLDDSVEYERFRMFAASCLSSELTTFIEEYQILKAETVALLQPGHRICSSDLGRYAVSTTAPSDAMGVAVDALGSIGPRSNVFSNSPAVLQGPASPNQLSATTSVTVTIAGALADSKAALAGDQIPQFPPQLVERLKSIYYDYVDTSSYSSVNASPVIVRHITGHMESGNYPITLFDELKAEVLFLLFSDVFMRYIRN